MVHEVTSYDSFNGSFAIRALLFLYFRVCHTLTHDHDRHHTQVTALATVLAFAGNC